MMTAVQAVFSDLEEMHPQLFNVYTTEGKEFINHFHKYLAIEREQIVKAYTDTGFGLGEVAEPKSQIEKLNLIIKKEC